MNNYSIFRNWQWNRFLSNALLMSVICFAIACLFFFTGWETELRHLFIDPFLSGLFSGAAITIFDDTKRNHLKKFYYYFFK